MLDRDIEEWETPLTRLLDLRVPVVQAPMGGEIARPELVAAVANAGGLGMLPLWLTDLKDVPKTIERTRSLTNRPFAVSFNVEFDPAERLQAALDCGASLVHFFWGDPSPYLRRVLDSGARAMLTVAGAKETQRAVDNGVSALIAQGWEAGGHVWSKVGGLALIPAVVDAANGAPVIAAGGIADGRGLAAALMLGASGALLGTRFVASEESGSHPAYRQAIVEADENDTDYNTLFDIGWEDAPLRCLRTKTLVEWEAAGRPPAGQRPHEGDVIGRMPNGVEVPRYHVLPPIQGIEGDPKDYCLYAGQGAALIREVKPAAEIVRDIVAEARAVISGAAGVMSAHGQGERRAGRRA